MHVVCKWMGNSEPVAARHYLQVTEEHYRQAVQNPVQQPAVQGRTVSQGKGEAPGFSGECDTMQCYTTVQVAEAGVEPARGRAPQDFKS